MTKRLLCVCLALVLLFGVLAGCSKNEAQTADDTKKTEQSDTEDKTSTQFAYQAQYYDLPEDIQWIGTSCVTGDTLYFTASIPDGGTETYTDENGEEYSYDTYSEVIFRFDLDTGECVQLDNYVSEPVEENPDMPNGVTMNPDGSMQTFPAFEGKDLDGNPVTSELFKNNAVTVVNFWFSACAPCIAELSELNALNEELKLKGGAVIGINADTIGGDESMIMEARNILEKKGAAYQNVYFPVESEAGKLTYSITAFPTTMVVDRNGNIVGEAILGGINNETQMKVLQDLIDETLARDMATLDKDMMMKPDGN